MAVAFDTQIAAYILNASLRSQTIADVVAEQLDLDPAAGRPELPAFARAGLEALVGDRRPATRSTRPLERRASTACSARSSCR